MLAVIHVQCEMFNPKFMEAKPKCSLRRISYNRIIDENCVILLCSTTCSGYCHSWTSIRPPFIQRMCFCFKAVKTKKRTITLKCMDPDQGETFAENEGREVTLTIDEILDRKCFLSK